MQKTYKGRTARQIVASSTADANGRSFVTIDGEFFTVVQHPRVELNNGNWAATVVLESRDNRIVLEAE